MTGTTHGVLRTWVRPVKGGPTDERPALDIVAGEGVVDDHARGGRRHVTLVLLDDGKAATADLGVDVDPSYRRANVLLSGGGAGKLLGRRIRIGQVEIDVAGETRPCGLMNAAAPGLEDALRPDVRAGVWGTVRCGGRVAPGDGLELLEPAD